MMLCVENAEDRIEWSSPSIVPGESGVDSSKNTEECSLEVSLVRGERKGKGKWGRRVVFIAEVIS
jgi:hypothetical protein